MEHLTISHIQHYLAYGLKVQCDVDDQIYEMTGLNTFGLTAQSPTLNTDKKQINSSYFYRIEEYKPLLLPLSALYEEIDGEIPADILFPKEYYSLIDFYEEHNRENQIKSFMNDGLKWCEPLDFWEYLFSKHFDVYGLIDNGLAIDKRSVK